MLLIHGLGSGRKIWRTITNELAQRYTVVSIDLLGHGDSDWLDPAPKEFSPLDHAEALHPFLERFDQQPHVVGNSMGGWIALEMAANGWTKSVTALCPAGLEFDPWVSRSDILVQRRIMARVLGPAMPPLTEAVGKTPGLRTLLIGDATADFGKLDKSLLGVAADALRHARGFFPSHDGMLHALFTRAEEISADIPVSIVWGTEDQLLPAARQRRVAGPPHADWIVFDDCAHVPMWDQPQRTVEVILNTAAHAD